MVRAFLADGIDVVVIDDLSSGKAEFVPDGVPFVQANLLDGTAVRGALDGVSGVVHLAGFKYAGVSVDRPLHTYTQNVTAMVSLLEAMAEKEVRNIVFSSSAGVYGTPKDEVVTEQTPPDPQSPYGETKLVGEWLLADQSRAVELNHTSLRYFNVVGSGDPSVYDASPYNLFPIVCDLLTQGKVPQIYGNDHPTPDGTSVKDPGDPSRVVANGDLAARDLAWKNTFTVDEMFATAWEAWPKN